jgi:hypothetical protein
MSDMVTGALLALSGALIGSLATIGIARAQRREVLRLAAVKKRLAAHQEAFALWFELLTSIHDPIKSTDAVVKCQTWWRQNCLYLEPKSRQAFWKGTSDAMWFDDMKQVRDPKAAFAELMAVFKLLEEGVGLPTIGEHEFAKLLGRQANK